MIRNRNILTMSSFAAMFFLGVGSAVIGAASRNIGISPYQIGLLLALMLALLVQATSFKAALVILPVIGVAGFMLALSHRKQLAII